MSKLTWFVAHYRHEVNNNDNNNTKLIPPLFTSLKGAMQINKVMSGYMQL